jgi:hypothetical protein
MNNYAFDGEITLLRPWIRDVDRYALGHGEGILAYGYKVSSFERVGPSVDDLLDSYFDKRVSQQWN